MQLYSDLIFLADSYIAFPWQGFVPDEASHQRLGEHDGKQMLQLLRNCSGAFRPGVLTALVGSSGAGKTTLMDCLAGRKTSERSRYCLLCLNSHSGGGVTVIFCR